MFLPFTQVFVALYAEFILVATSDNSCFIKNLSVFSIGGSKPFRLMEGDILAPTFCSLLVAFLWNGLTEIYQEEKNHLV